MVCSCFVHIELHGYGRLQKKQIVNKIRRGPILPQSEKAHDENEKFLDEFLPYRRPFLL